MSEIYLESKNASIIKSSLETAKMFSADAGDYGAERIQEIENKIKLEHPIENNRSEGAKR